jgi:hypothetical protein
MLPHLDERQQRLLMAAEARSLGHGGIAAVARATGASGRGSRKALTSWRPVRRRRDGCDVPERVASG